MDPITARSPGHEAGGARGGRGRLRPAVAVLVLLLAALVVLPAGAASAQSCQHDSCTSQDPVAAGCNDGLTSEAIRPLGGGPELDLRWSPACAAFWALVDAQGSASLPYKIYGAPTQSGRATTEQDAVSSGSARTYTRMLGEGYFVWACIQSYNSTDQWTCTKREGGIPGYFYLGPGCPGVNANHDDWDTHGSWTSAGGDYRAGHSVAGGLCSSQSLYYPTQTAQTAVFRWHFVRNNRSTQSCRVWAYIPTDHATDRHARYDFWADDGNGGLHWLAWPGHTVDQDLISGWTYLGAANVPPTYLFTVTLNNQDTQSPGWYAGAGDMSFDCR